MSTAIDIGSHPAPDEERERGAFLQSIEISTDPDDRAQVDVYLDHLLEQLAERESKIAENNEVTQRRMDMIDRWRVQVNGSIEREVQWLKLQVHATARDYDFGSKKSRSLPNGSFGYRRKPDTIEILDSEKAIAYAEAHGIPVKVTKELQKTPVKEHMKAGGSLPDGCAYIPGTEEFYVRAG